MEYNIFTDAEPVQLNNNKWSFFFRSFICLVWDFTFFLHKFNERKSPRFCIIAAQFCTFAISLLKIHHSQTSKNRLAVGFLCGFKSIQKRPFHRHGMWLRKHFYGFLVSLWCMQYRVNLFAVFNAIPTNYGCVSIFFLRFFFHFIFLWFFHCGVVGNVFLISIF